LFCFVLRKLNQSHSLTTGGVGSEVLGEGSQLHVGNKELQIDRAMQPSEYLSGACFGRGGIIDTPLPPLTNSTALSKQFIPLKPVALNPSFIRPPAPPKPEASVSRRKVIDLEPVSLLSQQVVQPKAQSESGNDIQSYWTANW
jgi:DNA repair and recombination protein RAD54B